MNTPIRFVCHVRASRKKAVEAAAVEMLGLVRDLNPVRCPGGPLSEQGSVFWIEVPRASAADAIDRFPRLGYTNAVDQLIAIQRPSTSRKSVVRWRKQYFKLARVYEEDEVLWREQAPDRRAFLLLDAEGIPRKVRGYRGDGTRSGRRALPVCDARLLVNTVRPQKADSIRFIDPFAGAGGIVIEACAHGFSAFSLDIDPIVSRGLKQLGASHALANTLHLPFRDSSFHAIATEPPYHEDLGPLVAHTLREIKRVLMPKGKVAMFCADWHRDILNIQAKALGLAAIFESPIDRKGTACRLLVWEKIG